MGRRIPKSTKHKKIKAVDPFYRGERRLSNKDDPKKNIKPVNPDDQEIPNKVKEIMENQSSTTVKRKRKRNKNMKISSMYNDGDEYGGDKEAQSVPTFKKRNGETDKSYITRIQLSAISALTQAKLETKFGVAYSETEDGKIEHNKTTSSDIGNAIPMSIKKVTTTNKKLKRKKFKEAKKTKKLAKRNDQKGDFDHLKDVVKFGVVAERPPSLSVLPRKATVTANPKLKAEKKKSLLLNKFLHSSDPNTDTSMDFSKRRKYLSIAVRRKLDTEKDRVVQAYRTLKAKQRQKK